MEKEKYSKNVEKVFQIYGSLKNSGEKKNLCSSQGIGQENSYITWIVWGKIRCSPIRGFLKVSEQVRTAYNHHSMEQSFPILRKN